MADTINTTDNKILKLTVTSTIAAVISVVTMAFTLGINYNKFTSLIDDQKEMKESLKSINTAVISQSVINKNAEEKLTNISADIKDMRADIKGLRK